MKNNKGFMLAEVVVTSTIILTALISFYTTFNNLYRRYEIHTKYYDIDGVYAIKELGNVLLERGDINTIIAKMNSEDKDYITIDCNTLSNANQKNKCSSIMELYNVNKIFFVKNDYDSISNLKNTDINKTFKDYLEYILRLNSKIKNVAKMIEEPYYGRTDYIFIMEYKNQKSSKDYLYSHLEFGKEKYIYTGEEA